MPANIFAMMTRIMEEVDTLFLIWKLRPECYGMLKEVLRSGRLVITDQMRLNFLLALERRAARSGRQDLFEIATEYRTYWGIE